MSKTDRDTNPELPAITELTKDQLNRLVCADYLEAIAGMIRKGNVNGFDLHWDLSTDKPIGEVGLDANYLIAPLEAKIAGAMRAYAQQQAQAEARKIPVIDATGHEKCENPDCIACNNPHKA